MYSLMEGFLLNIYQIGQIMKKGDKMFANFSRKNSYIFNVSKNYKFAMYKHFSAAPIRNRFMSSGWQLKWFELTID